MEGLQKRIKGARKGAKLGEEERRRRACGAAGRGETTRRTKS